MKILFILFIFLISYNLSFSQEEISLFDSKGKAIAFINLDDLTIYLWEGKPVAYLSQSNGDYNIYGFNGKHLGWFIKGIIRDHEGDAVGSTKEATSNFKDFEPFKGFKEFKPFKSFKEFEPFKPFFSASWSVTNFKLFLIQGVGDR